MSPDQTAHLDGPPDRPRQGDHPVRAIPRGPRAFDAADADFFPGLLPGPRDADGLSEAVGFWKRRAEAADPESAFGVGVLYGPSGGGKSSLVRAGLLPRLAGHVLAVYVEATADDTEARLLRGLRRRCPALTDAADLADALARLRRGDGLAPGQQALLVIDQLEQWLHAHPQPGPTVLVRALRRCDGERVRALLIVRDEFWTATTRLLRDLDVPPREGLNAAALDLFDPGHARRVLAAFGRALGALPDGPPAPEQERFLERAVAGLARDGAVAPVRLSLFAELVKRRPWVPDTLSAAGGVEEVGVRFLEDALGATEHRRHKQAAQSILQALLPESGRDIKGRPRSRQELLAASGYARRPEDFDRALAILDEELRLVTPSEPAAPAKDDSQPLAGAAGSEKERCYQLTHDYLVSVLRQWLTRERRQTRRGRAELCLAERAAAWQARPDRRQLPSWWEWASILAFTRRRDRTGPRREMMRAAARHHLARGTVVALLVLAAAAAACAAAWRDVRRRRGPDAAVAGAVGEAQLLRGQARAAAMGDAALYRAALAAARKGVDLAHARGASGDVRRQAGELALVLESEAAAAGRDRALLAALLEVRGAGQRPRPRTDGRAGPCPLAEPSADEQFATAFRAWGLDVDAAPLADAAVVIKAQRPVVAVEAVAALDEWAAQRHLGSSAARWHRLADLVMEIDAGVDAWRRRALRALLTRDRLPQERAVGALALALRPVPVPFDAGWGEDHGHLRELEAGADAAREHVLGVLMLARVLRVAGDDGAAERLLRAALRARPREVVLYNALGRLLEEQRPPRWRDAEECYAVLRAMRPELGLSLARVRVLSGRVDEGLALYEQLAAEQPDNHWLHARCGSALYGQGHYDEAARVLRRAVELEPDDPVGHANLGAALVALGRYEDAEAACRRALILRPDFPLAQHNLRAALAGRR